MRASEGSHMGGMGMGTMMMHQHDPFQLFYHSFNALICVM